MRCLSTGIVKKGEVEDALRADEIPVRGVHVAWLKGRVWQLGRRQAVGLIACEAHGRRGP